MDEDSFFFILNAEKNINVSFTSYSFLHMSKDDMTQSEWRFIPVTKLDSV